MITDFSATSCFALVCKKKMSKCIQVIPVKAGKWRDFNSKKCRQLSDTGNLEGHYSTPTIKSSPGTWQYKPYQKK